MQTCVSKTHKWNTADSITSMRMIACFFLLFFPFKSIAFFALYTLSGLTDVLDGWIARKNGTADEFGARLDSIADLMFYSAVMFRLFPFLWQGLPKEIWYAVACIIVVRLTAYCTAWIKYRRFASLHTILNKLTGAAVFLLPYVLIFSSGTMYCCAVCVLAFAAALEDLSIHLCRKSYHADTKSVFHKLKEDNK